MTKHMRLHKQQIFHFLKCQPNMELMSKQPFIHLLKPLPILMFNRPRKLNFKWLNLMMRPWSNKKRLQCFVVNVNCGKGKTSSITVNSLNWFSMSPIPHSTKEKVLMKILNILTLNYFRDRHFTKFHQPKILNFVYNSLQLILNWVSAEIPGSDWTSFWVSVSTSQFQ